MAALANGIDDVEFIEQMEYQPRENLDIDIGNEGDLKLNFPIIFALAYLDGVAGGALIREKSLEATMDEVSPLL